MGASCFLPLPVRLYKKKSTELYVSQGNFCSAMLDFDIITSLHNFYLIFFFNLVEFRLIETSVRDNVRNKRKVYLIEYNVQEKN